MTAALPRLGQKKSDEPGRLVASSYAADCSDLSYLKLKRHYQHCPALFHLVEKVGIAKSASRILGQCPGKRLLRCRFFCLDQSSAQQRFKKRPRFRKGNAANLFISRNLGKFFGDGNGLFKSAKFNLLFMTGRSPALFFYKTKNKF